MTASIPTKEPTEITAGDTWTWSRSLSDYLASDSWTLSYALVNVDNLITITATADGDDHLVEVAAATTAGYAPGSYNWQAYVIKSGERYQVDSGVLEVKPNFAEQTAGYDGRSHVKKVLDALDALIEGKATSDQLAYSIAGRSISKMSPEELIKWRDLYAGRYQREQSQACNGVSCC